MISAAAGVLFGMMKMGFTTTLLKLPNGEEHSLKFVRWWD
jgi:hypothetical protein